MRRLYIVSYDICNPKRLRKIFTIMRGFGDHLQLSVFRAELSMKECLQMKMQLDPIIHHDEDQILIIPLGPAGGEIEEEIEALGRPYEPQERSAIVV
ncbi:MAG: CRISPR-associated endonuclease Cas2 [Candidatus Hinthialibacter sp.]